MFTMTVLRLEWWLNAPSRRLRLVEFWWEAGTSSSWCLQYPEETFITLITVMWQKLIVTCSPSLTTWRESAVCFSDFRQFTSSYGVESSTAVRRIHSLPACQSCRQEQLQNVWSKQLLQVSVHYLEIIKLAHSILMHCSHCLIIACEIGEIEPFQLERLLTKWTQTASQCRTMAVRWTYSTLVQMLDFCKLSSSHWRGTCSDWKSRRRMDSTHVMRLRGR